MPARLVLAVRAQWGSDMVTCTHVYHLFGDVADLIYGISHSELKSLVPVVCCGYFESYIGASEVVYRVRILGAP